MLFLIPAKFCQMQGCNLGCRSHQTPNKPWKAKGRFTKEGIQWEQHPLAKGIKKNKRAYFLILSFEQQCNLVRPCARAKIHNNVTKHNKIRTNTIPICPSGPTCYILFVHPIWC